MKTGTSLMEGNGRKWEEVGGSENIAELPRVEWSTLEIVFERDGPVLKVAADLVRGEGAR